MPGWTKEPPYGVLFSNLSDQDGGQIVTALQQQNVPYKYSEGGGAIWCAVDQVHDARLRLASQGLPKGGMVGFELMENQKLGISQFAEQVNYQRGLEGELARSIQTLGAVRAARVTSGDPETDRLFARRPETLRLGAGQPAAGAHTRPRPDRRHRAPRVLFSAGSLPQPM